VLGRGGKDRLDPTYNWLTQLSDRFFPIGDEGGDAAIGEGVFDEDF